MKRENVGSWDSWLEKEQILETYSAQLQKSWNSMKVIFGINKNYWAKKVPEGAHTLSRRVGARPPLLGAPLSPGPPVGPPVSIFCYMKAFTLEKIISKLTGRKSAATRQNLGGTNLGLRWSCSVGETSLRDGEIITIVITNDPLIGRGSISINIFTSTISSQNPSSSLVSNLVSKPQIATCGLLVVLITPCSWC